MKRTASIIAAVLLFIANVLATSPAQAHDEVISVQPESGTTVPAGFIDLSITFSEAVLTTDGSSGFEVVVSNASGESQEVGCINPMGDSLSAQVAIGKAGDYTVSWRSVSADGHPIEGTYNFTVTGEENIENFRVDACPRALIAPAPESIEDPEAIAYSSAGEAVANDNTALEIGLLIAVVAMVVFFAIWVTARRKKSEN
ncbi:MAG: hypothetical protein RL101_113 [Actinomycetota bacterium]|jgi:methionine-rich copper-binding protein CopC